MSKEKRYHYAKVSRRHWELLVVLLLVLLAMVVLLGGNTFANALLGEGEEQEIKNIEDRTIKEEGIGLPAGAIQDQFDVKLNVTPE